MEPNQSQLLLQPQSKTPTAPSSSLLKEIKDVQNDITYFKDEVLRDMRKLELQLKANTDKKCSDLDKKIISMDTMLTKLSDKLITVSNSLTESTAQIDKVSQSTDIISKLEQRMNINEAKMSTTQKDVSEYNYRCEKMIMNNLLIPNLIGERCKYANMKEYISWINIQFDSLNTFRDKQTLDLKSYKEKLEKIFINFNNAIERVKATFLENCKESVVDCEKSFDERIKTTEEMITNMRMENNTYSLQLRNDLNTFREEWTKILAIKDELIIKFNNEVEQFKQESNKNIAKYTKFQSEYNIMKAKFIELSEFIRDVRFRANLGESLNRKDFYRMSRQLDLTKKSKLYLSKKNLKALDNEIFFTEKNKESSNSSQRRNTKSAADLSYYAPDYFDKLTKEEIKLYCHHRNKNKIKDEDRNLNCYRDNYGFNNKNISLLKKKNNNANLLHYKEDIIDNINQPNANGALLGSQKEKKVMYSDLMNNDNNNNNIKKIQHDYSNNNQQDYFEGYMANNNTNSKKNRSSAPRINYPQLNNNLTIQLIQPNSILKRDKDIPSYKVNNNGKHSIDVAQQYHYNDNPNSLLDTKMHMNKSQLDFHNKIKPNDIHDDNDESHNADKLAKINKEKQILISDLFSKLSATESRVFLLEDKTNKKLELIHQQFKRFFSQFIDENQQSGSKLRILKYPAGIFVPSNFDERNLDDYFPENKKNSSQSTKSMVKNDVSFNYQTRPLKVNKISRKNKMIESATTMKMHHPQTFHSLSVLMNNNPRRFMNEDSNLLYQKINSNLKGKA